MVGPVSPMPRPVMLTPRVPLTDRSISTIYPTPDTKYFFDFVMDRI